MPNFNKQFGAALSCLTVLKRRVGRFLPGTACVKEAPVIRAPVAAADGGSVWSVRTTRFALDLRRPF
jgi:hypothetical protein